MPSLNFQDRFVPLIESGQKRQTIRPIRKRNDIYPGCKLYLFTGLRNKNCKRIIAKNCKIITKEISRKNWLRKPYVVCKSVDKIKIGLRDIFINEKELMGCDMFSLAYKDGFENYTDFYFFFKKQYGVPFEGVIIKW